MDCVLDKNLSILKREIARSFDGEKIMGRQRYKDQVLEN